jgi:2-dehydro-3-deoxygluconokinase
MVFVKAGSGKTYVSAGDEKAYYPGFHVEHVVDTVGAGDGFAVGVLSAYLEGLSVPEMTERANAIGAMQVMVESDNEGLPDRAELEQFLKQNRCCS